MTPVLEQMASEHEGRLKIVKVDVDANPGLQSRFRIMSIPTMLVFNGGEVAKQLVGAMPKPRLESELSEWVGATA
jgi:thioredoxin 1